MLASGALKDLMRKTATLERSRPRQRRSRNLITLAVVAVLLYAFASQEIRLMTVRAQERDLEDAIRAQQVKNEILKEQIQILQDDEYIEKVAREQLGWIKQGEIQYVTEP
ncbi:MAG: FtsB family cell division protein [Ignavibacteriales bacterium]